MKDKRPTKRFAAPARAGRPLRPQQLLILAYAAAVIVWLVYVLVGSAVMLNHKADGTMVTRTLTADDLEFESFVNYDDDEWHTAPVDEPGWYLSTDNDPHIIWRGEAWLETVELDAVHYLPPGSVALYYLRPGQTEYSETQKVFARVSGENQYTFDLGGLTVTGLRIDPDSVGGVPTRLDGVVLNPVQPWYLRFVPNGGQWLLLLFAPAVGAAFPCLQVGGLGGAQGAHHFKIFFGVLFHHLHGVIHRDDAYQAVFMVHHRKGQKPICLKQMCGRLPAIQRANGDDAAIHQFVHMRTVRRKQKVF